MKNIWVGKLFPLGLVLLLFGTSFWLDQVSTLDHSNSSLNPNKPEYIVDGVHAKRFDEQGLLKEDFIASRTWQFPKSDDMFAKNPKVDIFENGIKKYHLVGEVSKYNTQTKVIYFDRQVTMEKMADAEHPEAKIITSALTADTEAQTVQSKNKVDFSYGTSTGSAVGFDYNHKTGLLNLNSRVSAIYEIPPNK
ncbi:LPS export ABC transporter periplasmic protein LptC [Neisseria sp. Ec49-e6-T10]|uniref:LPS export ABC transporter periplasmic protein LptC n=1 Tax=Neisseria sp. Ec49-e6-T10 TaxID=3140744 RepID=UPI003EB97764